MTTNINPKASAEAVASEGKVQRYFLSSGALVPVQGHGAAGWVAASDYVSLHTDYTAAVEARDAARSDADRHARDVLNALADYHAEKERAEALQAKIDALMLEYCPDEMTPEQVANWSAHQTPVTPEWEAERTARRNAVMERFRAVAAKRRAAPAGERKG